MSNRLNKVTKDLNVGITTVVEFLAKKGHAIKADPNTKITDEEYELLLKEFSDDKNLRMEADRFIHERKNKESKPSDSTDEIDVEPKKVKEEEVITATVPSDIRPHFKNVGKIDLDNPGKGIQKEKESSKPQSAAIKKEEEAIEPKKEEPVKEDVEPVVAKTVDKPEETKVVAPKTVDVKPTVQEVVSSQEEPAADNKSKVEEKVMPQEEVPVKLQEEVKAEPKVEKKDEPEMKPKSETPATEANEEKKNLENKNEEIKEPEETKKEDSPMIEKTVEAVTEEEKPADVETTKQEVFSIHADAVKPKLNIVGQIDLSTLNQSTRPKKKTKEEKRKEREEKEKIRQDQKKQMKEAIMKEIRKGGGENNPKPAGDNLSSNKKKRNRINNEKVDISKESSFTPRNSNDRRDSQKSGNNNQRNGSNSQDGNRRNRDRFRKQNVKEEISEEDVAKQVKETLARLTNKGKTKTSKYRKEKREQASNRQQELEKEEKKESKIIKLTEFVTANELATMMDVSVNQVISTCMSIGIMVSINQRLDAETINLVAEEFGFKTEYVSAEVAQAIEEEEDDEKDLVPRAPIVTVMGHVDHGKTSLLDYIRKANVIAGEAGGITQHIGAYNVRLEDGRKITFLDTPGHEAFTAMRARGAKVTDIAIIIVAADDHVMPQTKEAINHAMAANVPIVFAINKIDKPGANPDKIKEELAAMNFLVEEWGGKYQSQDISAKKGIGVKELMEKVLLEADILELKANPNRKATGSIIESSLDKGRGYVATILVSNGTLKVGDIVLAGASFGRVKAMFNERNQRIKQAGPSEPALILGLNGAPQAGDTFHVIDTDQEARELASKREQLQREQGLRTQKILTLDELGRRIALGNFKELNIIIKGDVDGSIEALKDSLIKLTTEQIQVNVIHAAVGQISESDVTLAAASDAIIVGFQVRPSAAARKYAEQEGVDIRLYSVIYDAIEEVKSAMEGMLAPEVKENVTSSIEVRQVFHITKVGTVAGAMVKEGKVKRSDKARVVRDGIVIFNGAINALKRFKDDVKEVGTNFECGISLVNYNDLRPGDIIETYEEIEVKQTL
jgi:translation initiation factor IF-2